MKIQTNHTSKMSRRGFLTKSGWMTAGTTVLFNTGCSLIPAIPTTKDNSEEDVNSWIQLRPDNRIRYFMGKAEMGQGVMSCLS
jgi:isoquinoline 1-oxidoreductase beta subunit